LRAGREKEEEETKIFEVKQWCVCVRGGGESCCALLLFVL